MGAASGGGSGTWPVTSPTSPSSTRGATPWSPLSWSLAGVGRPSALPPPRLSAKYSCSMLTEIDHVAIAVHDLEAAIDYYRATYGVEPVHRERIEKDGVDEALIKVADSYIQLLTPTRGDSPVAKFLAAKGEGMHHVGYRVDSCAAALDRVKGDGHRGIDEVPRPGSRG